MDEYAAGLSGDDFTPVIWPTQEDEKVVYAHVVTTWVRGLGPCQVLIVKPDPDADLEHARYWAMTRLDDILEQVVGHAAQRWTIEVLLADFKELMGSDHYQMRSARGIVRFWALELCLYQFLDEVRATHHRIWGERLTLGQARQQIRESHWERLLDWRASFSRFTCATPSSTSVCVLRRRVTSMLNAQLRWTRDTDSLFICVNPCESAS